jgi:hypothetical protein
MSLGRLGEVYYSATQARKKLELTEDAFQGWIKAKKVNKVVLPGRKQGVFLKREIDEIVFKIEAAILSAHKQHEYVYRTATVDDLDAENELAKLIFGESAVVPETVDAVQKFVETNPNISHHLYDHGRLVASINCVPLAHEGILKFKQGIRGWLLGEYIEQFVPDKPLECIIIDLLSTPLAPWDQREEYAMHLLRNFSRTLKHWGAQGVEIVSVHACGGTPQGKQILDKAGFTSLGKRNGRVIYELIVENATTPLLKPYKVALAEYKQEHEAA